VLEPCQDPPGARAAAKAVSCRCCCIAGLSRQRELAGGCTTRQQQLVIGGLEHQAAALTAAMDLWPYPAPAARESAAAGCSCHCRFAPTSITARAGASLQVANSVRARLPAGPGEVQLSTRSGLAKRQLRKEKPGTLLPPPPVADFSLTAARPPVFACSKKADLFLLGFSQESSSKLGWPHSQAALSRHRGFWASASSLRCTERRHWTEFERKTRRDAYTGKKEGRKATRWRIGRARRFSSWFPRGPPPLVSWPLGFPLLHLAKSALFSRPQLGLSKRPVQWVCF